MLAEGREIRVVCHQHGYRQRYGELGGGQATLPSGQVREVDRHSPREIHHPWHTDDDPGDRLGALIQHFVQ